MDPQSIPLPLPVEVQLWICNDDESRQKVKVCAVHPIQQWVIIADKTSVCIWDYTRQQCIMEKSLAEIIKGIEKGSGQRSTVATSSHEFVSSRSYQFNCPRPSGYRQCGALPRKNAPDSGEDLTGPVLKVKDVGEVKNVSFADRAAIQWQCGVTVPPTADSFHTASRVMIECEAAILFFDFAQQSYTHIVSTADLGKHTPTCAEFVSPDMCAVGCSDGNIRYAKIFAILQWKADM